MCYIASGGALGIHEAGQPTSLHCGNVCGGGVREATMLLANLLGSHPTFCHFPHFPQADVVLLGADSWVGGLV